MSRFLLNLYYQWDGISHSNPLAIEKSPAEIADALVQIPKEIQSNLSRDLAEMVVTNISKDRATFRLLTKISEDKLKKLIFEVIRDWDFRAIIEIEK